MTIPKFNELFTQVLTYLSDGLERSRREVHTSVAANLGLSKEELAETLSSGGSRAESRVGWAMIYLTHAGTISIPSRGKVKITDLGQKMLIEQTNGISLQDIKATEGFVEWDKAVRARKEQETSGSFADNSIDDDVTTPEEQIDQGVSRLRKTIATELLERIRNESPRFLEEVVLKVLHAMGYGEGEDDLEHLGGIGDEGVDGVINQDKLGLDQIYVQAKRYKEDSSIGRPDIQSFVGAISGKSATRGVFITTSRFTQDAREFATRLPQPRLILIDGNQLADLMIQHQIGVTVANQYMVYKIDENFFES